ncbi:hypothetical protein AMAG_17380 [Allomyces macrogynus ATCC 38327]|uniref:SEC7 domain-containing protein n=1 Tax=Allomyces macrogynus (strain ATCC 38327) TaxID=578462 RepID=A0A0L0TEL1_ALLM3|nr:hypothetical protein AMAG_17380 [Allomyces macrogynus ATCC 38327]|eukprot:KNE73187.1 hypothetical protein AMAG_17380 [Allomyces macrogynus ATCC 38327]
MDAPDAEDSARPQVHGGDTQATVDASAPAGAAADASVTTTAAGHDNAATDTAATDQTNPAALEARALFENRTDGTGVSDVFKIAAYLGTRSDYAHQLRRFYFANFEWGPNVSILAALRDLAGHLYLSAETQQLDRVLEAFAERFTTCVTAPLAAARRAASSRRLSRPDILSPRPAEANLGSAPTSRSSTLSRSPSRLSYSGPLQSTSASSYALDEVVTGSERALWLDLGDRAKELVHMLAFSLLLLNTDLHQHNQDHSRMTKRQFVANVLGGLTSYNLPASTITALDDVLRKYFSDVKRNEIAHPPFVQLRAQLPALLASNRKSSMSALSAFSALSPLTPASTIASPTLGPDAVVHRSSRNSSASPHLFSSSTSLYSISSSWRRKWADATHSGLDDSASSTRPSMESMRTLPSLLQLPVNGIKQCAMARKHLWSPAGRPPHRAWKNCLVQLTPDQIMVLSSLSSRRGSMPGLGSSGSLHHHDHLAIPNVHCLAATFTGLPHVAYSTSRSHVWSLTLPDGTVWLFQAPSAEDMHQWVALVNVWNARWSRGAALLRPESAVLGVGSARYGWEHDILAMDPPSDTDYLPRLMTWTPPEPVVVASHLDVAEQAKQCEQQLRRHEAALAAHVPLASALERAFPKITPSNVAQFRPCVQLPHGPPPFKNRTQLIKYANQVRDVALANWRTRLEHLNREVGKWHVYLAALMAPHVDGGPILLAPDMPPVVVPEPMIVEDAAGLDPEPESAAAAALMPPPLPAPPVDHLAVTALALAEAVRRSAPTVNLSQNHAVGTLATGRAGSGDLPLIPLSPVSL